MPELPEVECLTRAVRSVILGKRLQWARFYRADLRWPIPVEEFQERIVGHTVVNVDRRSKYMVITTDSGHAIIHLGMSGNILLSDKGEPEWKHTHATWAVETSEGMRYLHFVDPRRFGSVLCCAVDQLSEHKLMRDLGPEPLLSNDLAEHLWAKSRNRTAPIKTFLMDAHNVVGVGNIYANEALFRARIKPTRKAGSVKRGEWDLLASAVCEVLSAAIQAGGTSFRDYRHVDGGSGYFEVALQVYGREGEPCSLCGGAIALKKIAGRATYFCKTCQS